MRIGPHQAEPGHMSAPDPILSKAKPEWSVQAPGGGLWHDKAGNTWVSPWDPNVWDYNRDGRVDSGDAELANANSTSIVSGSALRLVTLPNKPIAVAPVSPRNARAGWTL